MSFGVSIDNKKILTDRPLSSDYLEIGAAGLNKFDRAELSSLESAVNDGTVKLSCANRLFPKDIRLTGDVNWDTVRDHCERTFYNLARLKVETVVFGSGKAKAVPVGFSREKAWDQLYTLGALLADEGKKYGQTVVVEPLSFDEVNIVNMTDEAADYCRKVNRDNFGLLIDFYHFDNNNDDWAVLDKVKDILYHTHIASPKLRSFFETDTDWAFCKKCIDALKNIGYQGAMSFEGRQYDSERLNETFARMREML